MRLILQTLPNPVTVIIDEFDRIESGSETCQLMTDTIKLFSDSLTPCSIVLVGVGQSIEDLITAHESISRNMDYVPVDPLEPEELAQIIEKGFKNADMTFESGLDSAIAQLSQGYPHYTHLLGQYAGVEATEKGTRHVTLEDLQRAIPRSLERAAGGIQVEYDKATDSTQPNNLFKEVLLACALAEKDARGRFPLRALQDPLRAVLRRQVYQSSYQRHLALFCDPARGSALARSGRSKNFRWSFTNPQLVPFIYLKGIQDGLIPDSWSPLTSIVDGVQASMDLP